MLKTLLGIAGISALLRSTLGDKINLDKIAQGDTLYLDLRVDPNSQTRWPVFEDLAKQGFKTYPKPDIVRCLSERHNLPKFEMLDAVVYGENLDKFLIKFENGTVAMLESKNVSGVVYANYSLFKEFKQGTQILFGRIYSYKGWSFYSFRIYYKWAGSEEVRVYDHYTLKDDVSNWQPKIVDYSKLKLVSFETPITKSEFLGMVAKNSDPSTLATDHLSIIQIVEPQGNQTEVKEIVHKLDSALLEASLTTSFSFTYFSSAHSSILVGEKMTTLDNLIFGGLSTEDKNNLLLFSCLIGEDKKIGNCISVFNGILNEGDYLLDARALVSSKLNPSTIAVQIATKVEEGHYIINQIDLNSTIKIKSMRPLTFSRTPYEEVNIHEFNLAHNTTSAIESFDNDALIFNFGDKNSDKAGRYMLMNNFVMAENSYTWSPMILLLSPSFKQIVRPSKFGTAPAVVALDEDRCFRTFKYRVDHYIEVDTVKYSNNSEIVLWYYRKQGTTEAVPFNETVVLNYTGGHKELVLKARSLKVTARNTSNINIETDVKKVSGYYSAGPDLMFEGEITPSYAKINANRIRYFLVSEDHSHEIQSSSIVGTVDRAVDLQNLQGYSDCNYEIAREIGVTCKTEFRVQLKNNKAVQVKFGESITYLALVSKDKATSSSLAIVNHALRTHREIDLPYGATKHAIKVSMNKLICLYVSRDGSLESTHVDLETFETRTTNYFVHDILDIAPSLSDSDGSFGVVTERESYTLGLNYRYNHSEPNSEIIYPANSVSHSYGSFRWTGMCFVRTDRYRNIIALSNGNKLFWSYAYRGSNPTIGISFNAPLDNLICASDGIYYTQGQNLIKILADNGKSDLMASRFGERIIYNVGGKPELIYSWGDFDYALINDGSSTTLKLLNRKGTTFIISRAPERASLEYQTGSGNSVLLPIDLTLVEKPNPSPVNLSKLGNYTYADGKLNFTISIGGASKSTDGHFWGFDNPNNSAIKVQNRFTYTRDLTYPEENYQVVDIAVTGHFTAYLVKNSISSKYSIAFKGIDIDEKFLLFHSREVREAPYIATFNYYIENSLPVLKAVIHVSNASFSTALVSIKYYNKEVTITRQNYFDSARSNRRFVTIFNTTITAYSMKDDEGNPYLTLNSDLGGKWWSVFREMGSLKLQKVEGYDLTGINDYATLVVKQQGSTLLSLYLLKMNDEKATMIRTNTSLDFLKDAEVSGMRCSAGEGSAFFCVFYGAKVFRVEFKLENEMKELIIMKIINFMPYKNMRYQDAVILQNGVVFIGRRDELTLLPRRDQYGFMFYPLTIEGDYKENSAYMTGGLDKDDLEKLKLGMNAQIKRGENDHTVIIGSPESGFKIFSVDNPTVLGKIQHNPRFWYRSKDLDFYRLGVQRKP